MVKLKGKVKKEVEIFGQSDIRILTFHPKVVWKTCAALFNQFIVRCLEER